MLLLLGALQLQKSRLLCKSKAVVGNFIGALHALVPEISIVAIPRGICSVPAPDLPRAF